MGISYCTDWTISDGGPWDVEMIYDACIKKVYQKEKGYCVTFKMYHTRMTTGQNAFRKAKKAHHALDPDHPWEHLSEVLLPAGL